MCRCCTSNAATTRESSMRSRAACRPSRAARKASTSCFAACCQPSHCRRTGSRIRGSRERWSSSSTARPPGSRAMSTSCASIARSRTEGAIMRLTDKIALVTGAGSGFGAGIARRFAAEGARVLVNDINAEAGKRIAAEVKGEFLQGDVTRSEDWARLAQAAPKLDVLVNNAGWTHRNKPYLEVSEAEFDRVYAVNVKS